MKLSDLLSIGMTQYQKRDGGNPHSSRLFADRATGIVRDMGEGFAVFIGSRLAAFCGDVGSARHLARESLTYGAKREDVSIKRVTV